MSVLLEVHVEIRQLTTQCARTQREDSPVFAFQDLLSMVEDVKVN